MKKTFAAAAIIVAGMSAPAFAQQTGNPSYPIAVTLDTGQVVHCRQNLNDPNLYCVDPSAPVVVQQGELSTSVINGPATVGAGLLMLGLVALSASSGT